MEENVIAEDAVKCIKPINANTVHKICSGQVVLSLAVAVKELVENALDAGASTIDVRLKNYGIDYLEVSDNGTGVTEDNFAALTLKYHTSKLNEYSDLLEVTSYGFRGEALSSLCALSNLVITTRHSSATYAVRIEYDNKGNIIKKTPCSRQVGTTVTLSNLFFSLPVRHKEFHKNAKREFNKMTQLLYAYCLISLNVKITCTNTTASNLKSVVVATQGSPSYKDNIACVFGSKQLQTILEIKPEYVSNIKDNIFHGLSLDVKDIEHNIKIEDVELYLSEDSNETDNNFTKLSQNSNSDIPRSQGYKNTSCPVEFVGFISSCAHGSGRSSSDRQFYYVNSRPCEPVKITKLVNEIYRQFNPHQYPFVFINVNLDRSSIDVNVSPDKRKLFLTKEKIVLDVIKTSLLKLYESIPRMLKVETDTQITNNIIAKEVNDDQTPMLSQPRIYNSFIQKFANKYSNEKNRLTTDLKRKSTTMLDFVSSKTVRIENDKDNHYINKSDYLPDQSLPEETEIKSNVISSKHKESYEKNNTSESYFGKPSHVVNIDIDNVKKSETVPQEKTYEYIDYNVPDTSNQNVDYIIEKSHTNTCKTTNSPCKLSSIKQNKVVTDKEDIGKQTRRSITLKTSLEHVKALHDIYNKKQNIKITTDRVRFRSQINPVFNKKCEEELSKEISKTSFKEMTVVGQFNLGFIITRLDEDLFIIDQHATDEIYNFETLQRTTELTSQKLVIPQQLELTGVNEQILIDNLDIFKKNGFSFLVDPSALPTKRVKLVTLPMSKNWIFGKEDIEELLFMLRESPNETCRPSRVRAMFASRACRKSVMIGTALSKKDMKVLVDHMADIDNPWNCPHGRPTIRHLVNLAIVRVQED